MRRHDDAASFADEWAELCRQLHRPPQDWPTWQACHARAFGTGRPGYLTARRAGRLVGVLPFERRRGVVGIPALRPHHPAGQPVVEDDDVLAALVRRLVDDRPREVVWREWCPEDWPVALVRRELAKALPRQRLAAPVLAPYVDLTRSWEEVEAGLSSSFRKDARRRRRRAEERWRVRHEVFREAVVPADLLERCFAIEASGWKGAQGTAIACLPHLRTFYTDVARWAAAQGWLRLDLLWFGDRLVAFQFNLQKDGVVRSLKIGYDDDFAAFAPGNLLDVAVMRDLVGEPVFRRAEFGAGETRAKLLWADGSHELHEFHAARTGMSAALTERAERARHGLRRQAAQRLSPAAVAGLRTVRGRTQQALAGLRARRGA
ncbi:GNAT family N-acetyltransferase [Egicoccus sp. AB-alg2]|uniref:GNAT family N-acetyltransferase n=1 Tax=Egicoccus sp. AB-alg2 TaxID=3242693 RepID=UPI00359E5473